MDLGSQIEPLVSVLMTAFNRENYIGEAIESVLNSNYKNFELIIVDDCSTDQTAEIAKFYEAKEVRIKVYINDVNLGDYPNRNKAASYAKGCYITYVDSDDKIFSSTLELMVESAIKFQGCGLVMVTRNQDQDNLTPVCLTPNEAYTEHFYKSGFLETGPLGVLISIVAFKELGGFSGRRMVGDTELWLKVAAKYPIVRIKKGLVFWRQHAGQEFKQGFKYYLIDMLEVYANTLGAKFCPLDENKRKLSFAKRKTKHYKTLVFFLLKTKKIIPFLKYWSQLKRINLPNP